MVYLLNNSRSLLVLLKVLAERRASGRYVDMFNKNAKIRLLVRINA